MSEVSDRNDDDRWLRFRAWERRHDVVQCLYDRGINPYIVDKLKKRALETGRWADFMTPDGIATLPDFELYRIKGIGPASVALVRRVIPEVVAPNTESS